MGLTETGANTPVSFYKKSRRLRRHYTIIIIVVVVVLIIALIVGTITRVVAVQLLHAALEKLTSPQRPFPAWMARPQYWPRKNSIAFASQYPSQTPR